MPTKSPAQERLMQAAAHTPGGYGGVPQAVGKEFTQADEAPIAPHAGSMGRAAGILFVSNEGEVLLLRRGNGGDFPHTWGLPGGHLEDGEALEDAARREALEETGFDFQGKLTLIRDDGQFAAFKAEWSDVAFPVVTCDESDGYIWSTLETIPFDLHPGLSEVLRINSADTELAVAELMRDGLVSSPNIYGNVALFDLRVTGTGTAYRTAIQEHVYRPPEEYLNPEFLARCNGLPVIFEHPDDSILNSKEFSDRVVGTIMLPYIKGDEVWGIARIYDAAAIKVMSERQLSTSPAVVFKNAADNATIELDNGDALLIEGKPCLLDHLAICEQGVWDKGGAPTGVNAINNEGQEMTAISEEKKADAEGGTMLDKILAAVDSLNKRMDSMEKNAPADPMPVAADKKADSKRRKDDDDDDDDKSRKDDDDKSRKDDDKSRKDNDKSCKDDDDDEEAEKKADEEMPMMADAQAKADSVFAAFGSAAPRPLQGETLLAYRKRLATKLKVHSADYKDINLHKIADSDLLAVAERKIYADAAVAARNPADLPVDQLIEIKETDRTGRQISTFRGRPDAWMRVHKSPGRRLHGINKGPF